MTLSYFCSDSKYAVLGPACNREATLTAALTSNNIHIVQVSYGADTPLLSDVKAFPFFYRTVPSYLSYHATIAAIMRQFDWKRIAVIHEEVRYYTVALEMLYEYLNDVIPGAELLASQGLASHLRLERTSPPEARIFIVLAPEAIAPAIMCAAYCLEMTGAQYQWILLGEYEEDWWKQTATLRPLLRTCSSQEMLQAIESTLIITHSSVQVQRIDEFVQGGERVDEFWSGFAGFFNVSEGQNFDIEQASQVPSAYDAVWSIALALNKVLDTMTDGENTSITQQNQNSGFSTQLNSAMETLDFQGVSGRITFTSDQHSHLPAETRVSQMQNGSMLQVGSHDERNDVLNLSDNLSWQGASGPPRHRPRLIIETVDIYLVSIMLSLVSLGLVFCVVVAAINCHYRKHKIIKASSPYINLLIISGCFMGFASVILISIENIDTHLHVAPRAYLFLCNARPWFLSLGYTLAFGALFAKTWRIYHIFKNPWKKNRPLKDHVLIAIVGALLSVDIVILVLWLIIDPLDRYLFKIDLEEESFTQEVHVVCSDRAVLDITSADFTIWIIVFMIKKGVLLVLGLFLVSRTAKIKAEVFQDAKYTGIAIYGVGLCCAVGVPVSLILMYTFQEDVGYLITTATITFCSYLILFMVFVPKIILLRKYRRKVPTAVLIGLNPSFRIRSRGKYSNFADKNKKNTRQDSHSKSENKSALTIAGRAQTHDLDSTSAVSILASSQADIDMVLIPACSEAGKDVDGILDGWEAAIEDDETDESTLKVREEEIELEGISYIANIIVEKETYNVMDGSSIAEEQDHFDINLQKEPLTAEDQTVTVIDSPILDATKRHMEGYSIDYTTTCVVEVHSPDFNP